MRGRLTLIAAVAAAVCGAVAASIWSQFLALQAVETHLAARRNPASTDPNIGDLLDYSQNLGLLITLATSTLVALMLICGLVLRNAVLVPLVDLAAQLRRVAAEGLTAAPIAIRAPQEIARVARDAEDMRRALQAQARATRAAEDGLLQQAPLVVAIREQQSPGVQRIGEILVASTSQPACGVVGGDWWQVVPWHEHGVALLVGDVVGHGERAALMAYALSTTLSGALLSGASLFNLAQLGCQVLRGCENNGTQLSFASCAVLLIDPPGKTMSWINAGHPAPLVTASNGAMHECDPTGPWLSAFGGTWSVQTRPFTDEDVVLVFTDGLTVGDAQFNSANSALVSGDSVLHSAVRTSVMHWFQSGALTDDFADLVRQVHDTVQSAHMDSGESRQDDRVLIALTSHR